MKKNLTFICVQPCIPYYAWQLEVMLTNFKNLRLHEHYSIHILCAYNKNESDWRENVKVVQTVNEAFRDVAHFFYYQDTRQYPIAYIPSIRPNLLKQHFIQQKNILTNAIFYHDCDISFTKFPDFIEKYIHGDEWYVSDTRSYLDYRYVRSKGEDILTEMAGIVGIHPDTIKENTQNSGGCHYILKNVDFDFFDKMEKDCEKLYRRINILNAEKKRQDPSYHELQIWCADMWAILWGAWIRGYKTNIVPEMDFCWATDRIEKWNDKYIFHNAGVTKEMASSVFYKGDFLNKYPYYLNVENYDKSKAAYSYLCLIKEIGEKSCLL